MEHASPLMASRIFASIVPVALALLGVMIANLPVSVFGGVAPAPLLGLMPIYFWGLVRPDLMPPFWAFAAGMLEDVLSMSSNFGPDRHREIKISNTPVTLHTITSGSIQNRWQGAYMVMICPPQVTRWAQLGSHTAKRPHCAVIVNFFLGVFFPQLAW